ncbi:MAG: hypothetical protein WBX02_15150 [Terriglobales bacterium]
MARAESKPTGARPLTLMTMALVALLMLAAPLPAFSQSCALCYTQAASAGTRMIQALRSGILILIVPPTFMSVCMIFIMRHKHNQFRQDDAETEGASDRSGREW